MNKKNIIIVAVALVIAFIGTILKLSKEVIYFNAVTFLLAYELYESWRFNQLISHKKTFQLKSDKWLAGLVATGFLIYLLSSEPLTFWNIIAIIEAISFGILYALRNRSLFYLIEENGIRNLTNNQMLIINRVKYDESELSIDSTEYEKDLVFKSTVLKSPSWDELTSDLSKLNKSKG